MQGDALPLAKQEEAMSHCKKGGKCFVASYLSFAAAFLVLAIGQAYNTIAFRPDYHGGWWEALTVGFFDWEGWRAFAESSAGKITYGGAALFLIASVVLFCLAIRFSNRSGKSD